MTGTPGSTRRRTVRARRPARWAWTLALMVGVGVPLGAAAAVPAQPAPVNARAAAGEDVLVGAGDIADCSLTQDSATAALIGATPGTVFTLGDNVYPDGTTSDFANCYQPTWGAAKARTRPVAGNHEYNTPNAVPYYSYFGAAAGDPAKGWYSYDIGTDWHVVVLNSNCSFVGGCQAGSPQEQWLRADLAASTRACTIAMWHHPRFSSGSYGSNTLTLAFWQALYQDGAELVLNGHDHVYERFAPQDPSGVADPTGGIRQFTVGTGGSDLRAFGTVKPNSVVRSSTAHGVLQLTLRPGSYDWNFLPIPGASLTDSGTGSCTGALSPAPAPAPVTPPGAPTTPAPVPADPTCLGRAATQVGAGSTVVGTPGDDVIVSGTATALHAGAGNDLVCVTGSQRGVRVVAGAGRDTVVGGTGPDRLLGNGGDDRVRGADGADVVLGGSGRDRILGGDGRDRLRGQDGRDTASGGHGRDLCAAERERACER